MRVVIDTNVIVSALVTRSGNPARVLEAALTGTFTAVMDSRMIDEAREVLARPVFAHTRHCSCLVSARPGRA
jgi:predicted nucleic acid-binding protein